MNKPLFRPEAMQSQRNSLLGSISLVQPPSLIWLTMLAVLAAFAVIGVLTFGEYTRRVHVSGFITGDGGASQLWAELEVANSEIGLIAPGATVSLRFPAFPHQKFGVHKGRVLDIAGRDDANHYRVVVAIERPNLGVDDLPMVLRAGMRVDADILAERRKLYQWLR